jgi:hypothetical protein
MDKRLERILLEDRDLSHRGNEEIFPRRLILRDTAISYASPNTLAEMLKSEPSMVSRLFPRAVRLYGLHEDRVP